MVPVICMARKAKKKMHKMPPLSFVDKLIYWGIFAVLCAAYVALMFGPLQLRHVIAFSDEAVIAAADHFSVFWLGVPWLTFFLMTFILWLQPYQNRTPIFGKKGFKYGPPAWPKVYPLFMKNKPPVWVSENKKKQRKSFAIFLLVVLLVSFLFLPLSLYGRDCLRYDGSIVEYDMFGRQVEEFSPGDIEEVTVDLFRYDTGGKYHKSHHWGVQLKLRTRGGERYTFDHREFDNGGARLYLTQMVNVVSRYDPSVIRYEDVDKLDNLVWDKDLSDEETHLLYQLFGKEAP